MTKCECGFEFVPDRPLTRTVAVICPRCGARATLRPENKRAPKGKKEEVDS